MSAKKTSEPDDTEAKEAGKTVGDGDLRGSYEMGTAVISGATFTNKAVTYYNVEGVAIIEGDIAIGMVSDIEQQTAEAREAVASDPAVAFGVGITGSQFRWPNCKIPYEIDPALPNKDRVTDAIAHWESKTAFRFPLRTSSNASQYPNYVRFTDAGGCWSMVGMQGGQQTISLGSGCSTGNCIHEIGHAVGLWHEQSREDRDLFVTIMWQNIQSGMSSQFNQHITDGDDLGAYDYGSIMHYPRKAFSKNGQDTIVPTDPTAVIGQRNGLSAGDIAAVKQMYPGCYVVKPIWSDRTYFKKIVDQYRFKKVFDDPKVIKPALDPGPIKIARDPMPRLPGTIGRPGVRLPFSLATPHHADMASQFGAAGDLGAEMEEFVAALEQQILDLDAAIAEANAQSAQANAEVARMQQSRDELAAMYYELLGAGDGE